MSTSVQFVQTMAIASFDLFFNGTALESAKVRALSVDKASGSPDLAKMIVLETRPDLLNAQVEIKVRLMDDAKTESTRIFYGRVTEVVPAHASPDSTRIIAIDYLAGAQLAEVPGPIEIVSYLGDRSRGYVSAMSAFLLATNSDGKTEIALILKDYHIKKLLGALPGGYQKNADKFTAKLMAILPLSPAERGKYRTALIAAVKAVSEVDFITRSGYITEDNRFRMLYHYPSNGSKAGFQVIVTDGLDQSTKPFSDKDPYTRLE